MRGLLRLQQARPATKAALILGATASAWLAWSLFWNAPDRVVADRLERLLVANSASEQELEGLEPRVAVLALVRVIERQQSRLKDFYQEIYFKVLKPVFNNRPAFWQRVLPVPADRQRVTRTGLLMLARFGPKAAPAVPLLIRLYEREYAAPLAKRSSFAEVTSVLGRIGPAATSAIPALLVSLDPRGNPFSVSPTAALLRIDPTGDETERAMSVLSRSSLHAGLGVAIATNCAARLASDWWEQPPVGSWEVFEAASCVRSEATRVVPVMQHWLQAEDERYRAKIAACLGRLGPAARGAAPEIRTLLQDPWLMVREAATNALISIEGQKP